jgi:Domain of unknown function (DUF5076)
MAHELTIPPVAKSDPRSLEMIRVWLAKGQLHCVLNIGFWEEQGLDERQAWGILLADMVHHIANAHESEYGRDKRESLAMIRETLEIEMNHPTPARCGDFVIDRRGK